MYINYYIYFMNEKISENFINFLVEFSQYQRLQNPKRKQELDLLWTLFKPHIENIDSHTFVELFKKKIQFIDKENISADKKILILSAMKGIEILKIQKIALTDKNLKKCNEISQNLHALIDLSHEPINIALIGKQSSTIPFMLTSFDLEEIIEEMSTLREKELVENQEIWTAPPTIWNKFTNKIRNLIQISLNSLSFSSQQNKEIAQSLIQVHEQQILEISKIAEEQYIQKFGQKPFVELERISLSDHPSAPVASSLLKFGIHLKKIKKEIKEKSIDKKDIDYLNSLKKFYKEKIIHDLQNLCLENKDERLQAFLEELCLDIYTKIDLNPSFKNIVEKYSFPRQKISTNENSLFETTQTFFKDLKTASVAFLPKIQVFIKNIKKVIGIRIDPQPQENLIHHQFNLQIPKQEFYLGEEQLQEKNLPVISMGSPIISVKEQLILDPTFENFLRSYRHANKRHLFVSHLDIREQRKFGITQKLLEKEQKSAAAFQEAASAFKNTLQLVILSKNSDFYLQKNTNAQQSVEEFILEFQNELFIKSEKESGIVLPDALKMNEKFKKNVLHILKEISQTFDKNELSREDRRIFIDISYINIIKFLLQITEVDSLSISAGEDLDRGITTTALLYANQVYEKNLPKEENQISPEIISKFQEILAGRTLILRQRPLVKLRKERIENTLLHLEKRSYSSKLLIKLHKTLGAYASIPPKISLIIKKIEEWDAKENRNFVSFFEETLEQINILKKINEKWLSSSSLTEKEKTEKTELEKSLDNFFGMVLNLEEELGGPLKRDEYEEMKIFAMALIEKAKIMNSQINEDSVRAFLYFDELNFDEKKEPFYKKIDHLKDMKGPLSRFIKGQYKEYHLAKMAGKITDSKAQREEGFFINRQLCLQRAGWRKIQRTSSQPFISGIRTIEFALPYKSKTRAEASLDISILGKLDDSQTKKVFHSIQNIAASIWWEKLDWKSIKDIHSPLMNKSTLEDLEKLTFLNNEQKLQVFQIACDFTSRINQKLSLALMSIGDVPERTFK